MPKHTCWRCRDAGVISDVGLALQPCPECRPTDAAYYAEALVAEAQGTPLPDADIQEADDV